MVDQREPGSFRDRNGGIFYEGEAVYRVVYASYAHSYDLLFQSGLYKVLVAQGWLLPHEEVAPADYPPFAGALSSVYKVLRVEKIPFISYPYEWCFSQLKEAALLTLHIQLAALAHGMTLKDASAFNVQFYKGRPQFIDTLSFEPYGDGKPWIAYRQFCTHFLAPLALLSLVTTDLRHLSQFYLDGIPLSLTSKLLPFKTKLSPFYQMHLHFHAKLEAKYAGDEKVTKKIGHPLSKNKLTAIIQHLESGIKDLCLPPAHTEWGNYYEEFSYSDAAITHKKELVLQWGSELRPNITWDFGCNTGLFSELIQPFSDDVISFDIDYTAIEKFYHRVKEKGLTNVLPLLMDLNNPSPDLGWAGSERKSLMERGPANLILALALIHHLSIGNNVPFNKVAALLSRLTTYLIIEFVPKEDPQAQRLLVTREDIFEDYHQSGFEQSFAPFFAIEKSQPITGTSRILYLMVSRL